MKDWLVRNRLPLGAFATALVVFAATAGTRLERGSSDSHFAAQAQAWLEGRLDIASWPRGADDPAKVEEVRLDDGSLQRGRRIGARSTFRTLAGAEYEEERIVESLRTIHYVSFPPFPALLMLPQVLVNGVRANDVATTVFLAALVPAVLLVLLRRLRAAGRSQRTPAEDVWLAVLLAFGTVFYVSAVQGRVWYTAHVVGVLLAILYAWASIDARQPVLAGLFLGCAFATRTPMLFMFPLFVLEAWREKDRLRRLIAFAAPIAAIGLVVAWHNWARFESLTEFGHSYLAVRQQAQIEAHGLFSMHYLTRNLASALTLLPELDSYTPYIGISGHGLAIWFTSPALLVVLWPRAKGQLHRALWVTIALVAAWSLFYQNSGWLQFGYRFSLDYMVFLIMLVAIGERPLCRWVKTLIILGVVINLFGAVTFQRMPGFYRSDPAAYRCVVAH